jgi:ribosomal-protein-alanine N-acetyltransferase
VSPVYRNQGLAAEATAALIDWARQQDVRKVIASIAPTNAPSLRVAEQLGFVQTGSAWDEEDGEELIFELLVQERRPVRVAPCVRDHSSDRTQ